MSKSQPLNKKNALGKIYQELPEIDFPVELCCPITTDLMLDPVSTECGHTFSKEALVDWVETSHDSCPMCRVSLQGVKKFDTNDEMASQIRSFFIDRLKESTSFSETIQLSNALHMLRGEYHLILNPEYEVLFHAITNNLPEVYNNMDFNVTSPQGKNALDAIALSWDQEAFEHFIFGESSRLPDLTVRKDKSRSYRDWELQRFFKRALKKAKNVSQQIKCSNEFHRFRGEKHLVLNEEYEVLFHAIKNNLTDIYKNMDCNIISASGRNALHAAVITGNREAFEYFRSKNHYGIHDADNKGETPFILAVKCGTTDFLFENEPYDWNQYVSVSYRSLSNDNPTFYFPPSRVRDMIYKTICRGDGDYDSPLSRCTGYYARIGFYESPLVFSVLHNQPTSCQYLIKLYETSYSSIVYRTGPAENDIYTALMLAAKLGHTIAFKAIVDTMDQSGMAISQYIKESFKHNILSQACSKENIDICQYIIIERSEPWSVSYQSIWNVLGDRVYDFFMKLVEAGYTGAARKMLNTEGRRKFSADHLTKGLLVAAEKGHTSMCNLLVSRGVPVDCCLEDGETAIYKAAQHGHLDTFKWLLIAGSDLRIDRLSHILKIESLLPNEARSAFTVSKSDMDFWVSAKCKRYLKDTNDRIQRSRHSLSSSNGSALQSKSESILAFLNFIQEPSLTNLSVVNQHKSVLTGREIFNTIVQPYIELSGFDDTEHGPEHIFSLWFDSCVRDMTIDASEERVLVVN